MSDKTINVLKIILILILIGSNGAISWFGYNMNMEVSKLSEMATKNTTDSEAMKKLTMENTALTAIVKDLTVKNEKMWNSQYNNQGEGNSTKSENIENMDNIPVTTENINISQIPGVPSK